MKVYVIHGPNMNMLGIREPDIYGRQTYDDLVEYIRARCEENGMEPEFFQLDDPEAQPEPLVFRGLSVAPGQGFSPKENAAPKS